MHRGETTCPICMKILSQKGSLSRHMAKLHPQFFAWSISVCLVRKTDVISFLQMAVLCGQLYVHKAWLPLHEILAKVVTIEELLVLSSVGLFRCFFLYVGFRSCVAGYQFGFLFQVASGSAPSVFGYSLVYRRTISTRLSTAVKPPVPFVRRYLVKKDVSGGIWKSFIPNLTVGRLSLSVRNCDQLFRVSLSVRPDQSPFYRSIQQSNQKQKTWRPVDRWNTR